MEVSTLLLRTPQFLKQAAHMTFMPAASIAVQLGPSAGRQSKQRHNLHTVAALSCMHYACSAHS
jgi:hypothetical protein